MYKTFFFAFLCSTAVSLYWLNSAPESAIDQKEIARTVRLDSPFLSAKLADLKTVHEPNETHFYLSLPADSTSEIELQSFDCHVDIVGLVAFSDSDGEQVLLPRKLLSDARLESVSDEMKRCRERGHDVEWLVSRNIKWDLNLSSDKSEVEVFEKQKIWVHGACWISNLKEPTIPMFDPAEPKLIKTREVWVAKRNLYPWQRLSKDDVELQVRSINKLPQDAACSEKQIEGCSLNCYSGVEANATIRAFRLRYPHDGIPCTNFQTGPIGRSVMNSVVDFSRTPFDAAPLPQKWDVIGEFYNSPKRLIQGAKVKRVVARNTRIFTAPFPYKTYPGVKDDSTTIVGLLMDDTEKRKYIAAKKIKSGNFWLVPTGSASCDDLFQNPPGLHEHLTNLKATNSHHVTLKQVWIANRDFREGDIFDEYNVYAGDVPETFLTRAMLSSGEGTIYGRKATSHLKAGEILAADFFE